MEWAVAGAAGAVAVGATSVRDRGAVAVVAGDGWGAADWEGPKRRQRPSWQSDGLPCGSGAEAAATAAVIAVLWSRLDDEGDGEGDVDGVDGVGAGGAGGAGATQWTRWARRPD